ncbi:hypothetical protein K435DRAFT_936563 [Dendrothele bispora CBS 962.96]|uniref:Uncharacterized protein n=1 Tax=Dendrothele bispora (strain CBS 962.96) TaxID=1314807 RepID=A0A4S8MBJ9_DENBC|nr:hypothetical protein K435DRAFT_936563 [Dendrothele bispora CBS 962.96]
MPSEDVPHEIRKTEEERRRDWISLMEAVGKLWFAAEEFWVRLKGKPSVSMPTRSDGFDSRLEEQLRGPASNRYGREWERSGCLIPWGLSIFSRSTSYTGMKINSKESDGKDQKRRYGVREP